MLSRIIPKLIHIVVITICAVIYGADKWEESEIGFISKKAVDKGY